MDVMCVWSYLGYNRLARAASRYRAEGAEVTISFRPYQLAPDLPSAGEPVLDVLRKRFGEGAVAETDHVASVAADEGIDVHYDRAIATNTFEAHRLIALASRQGLGEAMVERLFRAHFTDGANVADRESLSALAADVGVTEGSVPVGEVRTDIDDVRRSGVGGVPVFWFGDGSTLSGFQSEQALLDALRASGSGGAEN